MSIEKIARSNYSIHMVWRRIVSIVAMLFKHFSIVLTLCCSIIFLGVGFSIEANSAGSEVVSNMDCVVEPSMVVNLGSAVPGLLAETYFDRSDYVGKGDVLATLESSVEQAYLAIAEEVAAHATAVDLRRVSANFGERTRERNATLLETASISQQNMDQVETETKIARLHVKQEEESRRLALLEVDRAKASLLKRRIVSPIEGSITKRYKAAGEYVDSDPVFEVAQLNPLHVEVILPLEYLGQVESGMSAGVRLFAPGFEEVKLNAVVRRIDAVADAGSATYGVRLIMNNPDLTIPSGVRCEIDFYASP